MTGQWTPRSIDRDVLIVTALGTLQLDAQLETNQLACVTRSTAWLGGKGWLPNVLPSVDTRVLAEQPSWSDMCSLLAGEEKAKHGQECLRQRGREKPLSDYRPMLYHVKKTMVKVVSSFTN